MHTRPTLQSDAELIATIRERSGREREMACSEIYSRYSQKVYVYCRRILDDSRSAEDILQETFVRLVKSAQSDVVIENVHSFIFRIARNLCLNMKRERRVELIEFEEFSHSNSGSQFDNQDLKEVLSLSLNILPDDHREAVVLQLYNGYSYDEIGTMMNVPVTTVRNWVVRAKAKLRATLAPYFDNDDLKPL